MASTDCLCSGLSCAAAHVFSIHSTAPHDRRTIGPPPGVVASPDASGLGAWCAPAVAAAALSLEALRPCLGRRPPPGRRLVPLRPRRRGGAPAAPSARAAAPEDAGVPLGDVLEAARTSPGLCLVGAGARGDPPAPVRGSQ